MTNTLKIADSEVFAKRHRQSRKTMSLLTMNLGLDELFDVHEILDEDDTVD
jgi:hypothetical protein